MVVVPANAPRNKIEAIRSYGAELRLEGANYDEAEAWTLHLARNTNDYSFVSPYNDRLVVLGQGTLGFEILEQLPKVVAIAVPIGGGGLAAGIAAEVKKLPARVPGIGVLNGGSSPILQFLKAGRSVTITIVPTMT